jgi:FKBP-type peptidyl-prolyl cis-trans isomerase
MYITDSEGESPEVGDIMVMHFTYSSDNDSVLFNTKAIKDSFLVELVAPTFKGGVEEGFAMMSPGDSVHFKVSADSVYKHVLYKQLPGFLEKGSDLLFRVKMNGFINRAVFDSLERARDIESRRREFVEIEQYMTENDFEVMPTENGLYFQSLKEGSGLHPGTGDTVVLKYTASLLNGYEFDSDERLGHPLEVVLGNNMVLPGMEEGLPLMKAGGRARMLLPSDLAFGDRHVGEVPPYSSIVFEVELLEVR